MDRPRLIIGSPVMTTIPFWKCLDIDAVMFNAYDIITKKRIYARILQGEGLRSILGIPERVEIWIDSGGYQIMKKGITISRERVAQLYNKLDAEYFISLDYPLLPTDDDFTRYRKITKTIKNYHFLTSRVDRPVIPVVHYSPNIEDVERLIESYEENDPEIVAFGGFVPPLMVPKGMHNTRTRSILLLVYLIKRMESQEVHVMGAGSNSLVPILRVLNVYSTDSSTWRVKASYGKIVLPWGGERHASPRKANFGGKLLNMHELEELHKLVSTMGGSIFEGINSADDLKDYLFSRFENRAIFNLWVVLNFSRKFKPRSPLFRKLYDIALKARELSLHELLKILRKMDSSRRISLQELINYVDVLSKETEGKSMAEKLITPTRSASSHTLP